MPHAENEDLLEGIRNSLMQTLEAVVSHTLSCEVVHGTYVHHSEPTRIADVLRLNSSPDEPRFQERVEYVNMVSCILPW